MFLFLKKCLPVLPNNTDVGMSQYTSIQKYRLLLYMIKINEYIFFVYKSWAQIFTFNVHIKRPSNVTIAIVKVVKLGKYPHFWGANRNTKINVLTSHPFILTLGNPSLILDSLKFECLLGN